MTVPANDIINRMNQKQTELDNQNWNVYQPITVDEYGRYVVGGVPIGEPPPTAQTCTQDTTGATTTNAVISSGTATLTANATLGGRFDITTVPRGISKGLPTKASSSREATGTVAAARTTHTKRAKRLNVPVAIVLLDRVGKGKKARMKAIRLQVIGVTNGTTRLGLRKRVVVGAKTVTITKTVTVNGVAKKVRTTIKVPKRIAISRHARVAVVMLRPRGKRLYATIGMFPR